MPVRETTVRIEQTRKHLFSGLYLKLRGFCILCRRQRLLSLRDAVYILYARTN